MDLYNIALDLIKTRIPGMRKGTTDIPNWTHSQHVYEILKQHDVAEEVCLAGLLHDVVEDGGVSFDELKTLGFSDRTVALVDLCTHTMTMPDGDARWVKMIARLIDANDHDAWLIKLADVLDNARSSGTMRPDRARFTKQVKVQLLLALTYSLVDDHGIWKDLSRFFHENP